MSPQNGHNGRNGNVVGWKIAMLLFTVLNGVIGALAAWSLKQTIDLSLELRELRTRVRIYHSEPDGGE